MGKKSEYFTKESDGEFFDYRYDHSAYDDDDGFDGYEMSATIDPHYELLLSIALYCCAISMLVFLVVKLGRPRRFSHFVQKVGDGASFTWGKICPALTKGNGKSKEAENNAVELTETSGHGDDSVTPYQNLEANGDNSTCTTKDARNSLDISSSREVEQRPSVSPSNDEKKDKLLLEPSAYRWPGLCNLVNEMMTIHKLAAPWLFSSLVSNGYSIAVVYLISHYIGEDDSVAYVTVEFYLYMFHLFSSGIYDAFYRNANVAIGSDDHALVGHQTHIAILFAGVFSVPAIVFSLFWMQDFLLWLGFSDYIAAKGHDYALLSSCLALFDNANGIWWSLLDLTGHEFFSAGFDFAESISGLTLTAIGIIHYDFSLWELGLLNIAHSVLWNIISLPILAYVGWLKPYYRGIFSITSLANIDARNAILRTAAPLVLVSISLDLEWRVLSLMIDKALGPAEAAAWILLDYVWTLLETWTGTFASAAEQIVTKYLYSGSLHQARATTNATLVFGFLYGCIESLILVLISDWLISILTLDETLTTIMKGLIPYLALGNPFVSLGSVASSLNESQGKYWVGLCFYWISSLFITIPVAAILSFVIGVNAEGIAAAVVMGYTTSGLAHVGLLVEADYEKIIEDWQDDEDSDDKEDAVVDENEPDKENSNREIV